MLRIRRMHVLSATLVCATATRALGATPAAAHPPNATALTLTLATSSVVGGNSTTATITLSVAAPAGGAQVTLTNPLGTTVHAGVNQVGIIHQIGTTTVSIPAGQQSVTVSILTAGVAAATSATFTAKSGADAASATLMITPATIRTVAANPASVTGGQPVSLTITLDGAAAGGTGIDVSLAATLSPLKVSDGSVRTIEQSQELSPQVPNSVHFPPGATSATVAIGTVPVVTDQSIQIMAVLGATVVPASIVVRAPSVTRIQIAPSVVVAGNTTTGTVTLTGPAAPTGFRVQLTSNSTSVTLPITVSVPSGASSATFPIVTRANSLAPNAAPLVATISTGFFAGNASGISDGTSNTVVIGETSAPPSVTLTVLPPVLLHAVRIAPASVTAGDSITVVLSFGTGTFQVSQVSTPEPVIPAGTATISVDQPALVQLPSSLAIETNTLSTGARGSTTPSATTNTATINVTFAGLTISTRVLLVATPPALESFTLRPTTAVGGNSLIASFKLLSSITAARTVTLTTDRPDLVQLPSSVSVPVSAVPTPFTFKTLAVQQQTTATVTATAGAQSLSVVLTLLPKS